MNKKFLLLAFIAITGGCIYGSIQLDGQTGNYLLYAGLICALITIILGFLCSKEQHAYNEQHKIKVIHFRDNLDNISRAATSITRAVKSAPTSRNNKSVSISIGTSNSSNRYNGYDRNAVKNIAYYTEDQLKKMIKMRALFGKYQILYPENYQGEDFGNGTY